MTMATSAARVINPVLTTHAQGYRNAECVHHALFPRVNVAVSGGQVLEFDKEAFKAYSTLRAPGGATRRLEIGYLGRTFALKNHSLEGKVPRELQRDASVVPGIDLGKRTVNTVMRALDLELEIEAAALATDAAQYDSSHKITQSGTSKWSNASCDPIAQIDTAKEAIRSSVGVRPNTLVLSPVAWTALRNNTNVKDRFKYTSAQSITLEMIASITDLQRVVRGDCVKSTDAGVFSDVWGNFAVLAYTELGSPEVEAPSYGYCYTMDGHPLVEEAYYENNAKSWIYPVAYERVPVHSGITAGYLFIAPN